MLVIWFILSLFERASSCGKRKGHQRDGPVLLISTCGLFPPQMAGLTAVADDDIIPGLLERLDLLGR